MPKLTIFDSIERCKGIFQRNPSKQLISASECGDIAEEAKLSPVPVVEKTAVLWYWVRDVKAAIVKYEEKMAQYKALQGLNQSANADEPTPINFPSKTTGERVSLEDMGELKNPIKLPEAEQTAPTSTDPTAATVTDDAGDRVADDETSAAEATDGPVAGTFEQLGLTGQAIKALQNNGVESVGALNTLVDSQGLAGLKSLDGVGEKLAEQIHNAVHPVAIA